MKLNFKKLGKGQPVIILHGLLGMLDNWQTIGKILSQFFEVFLVDARNHGHSPHSHIFSYDAMANDLLEFISSGDFHGNSVLQGNSLRNEEVVIIGHSMGGKTAMKFAQHYPEKVKKLVVVDISPGQYPVRNDQIIDALLEVDLNRLKSRSEVEAFLAKYIPENNILQFLLKNLFWKEKGQLGWRFNLDAIIKNIEKVGEATASPVFEKPSLFLRGELSDYVSWKDIELIKGIFPQSEMVTIPDAGHWIHADQPELFVRLVMNFLKNDSFPVSGG